MSKKKKKKQAECPFIICPTDGPTKVSHLGWRVVYTLIAWIALAWDVQEGTSFFTSVFLFSLPLFMEYLRFSPDKKWRIHMKKIQYRICGFFVLVGLFGMKGMFYIEETDKYKSIVLSPKFPFGNSFIGFDNGWLIIGILVFLTIVDWIAYETILEKKVITDVSNA